jgi:hypothetical protein
MGEDLLGMRGVVERWRGQFMKSGAGKLNKYYFAERRHRCYFFDLRLLHSRQLNILFTLPHIRPAAEPAGPGLELKLASYLGRVLVIEGARKATEHQDAARKRLWYTKDMPEALGRLYTCTYSLS